MAGQERLDIHNSSIPVVCQACEARHKGVCGAMTPDELQRLSRHTTIRRHPAKTLLVTEEEPIETYANLLSGVVKLSKTLADGRQQIVGLQFAPDFVGRPFQKESQVCAEAASDITLCYFPKTIIEGMLKEQPELERRLLRQALGELDEARDLMLTLGRKTAEEKLASFLYMIARHIDPTIDPHETNTTSFDLPLTRTDIADFLGLTIETVSRQLTKMRKSDVIRVENNRHFLIPDLERLKEISGS
ncbi:MAG: Crp/Fnr family transcriptional regulator [Alphaproteobacteria bacterium]|nr:Crp/Fnr family transcriptional regulator [Alphaproteobacteria bacterium]